MHSYFQALTRNCVKKPISNGLVAVKQTVKMTYFYESPSLLNDKSFKTNKQASKREYARHLISFTREKENTFVGIAFPFLRMSISNL